MSAKKINVKHNSKPIFKTKKQTGSSVIGIIFMLAVLAALVFVGYSVGKPVLDFLKGERNTPVGKNDPLPPEPPSISLPEVSKPITSADESETDATIPEEEVRTDSETNVDNAVSRTNSVYYISYPKDSLVDYQDYILSNIDTAKADGYTGVCVELILNGGGVAYTPQSSKAIEAGAVIQNAVDLSAIKSAADGLKLYARVSALSDNIASWFDKGISYMIEGSESRWLDNSVSKGGKPWISPYAKGAGEYIGGLVNEISAAGFDGIVVGELEFPPLRQSDMSLIGSPVQASDRYKALASFAETVYYGFGTAKEFYIEVDAEDIISGKAEILTDPDALCTSNVYVSINLSTMNKRIRRADGTEVSFEGLNDLYLLKTVFRLVDEALSGSGIKAIPMVTGCEMTDELSAQIADICADKTAIVGR